MENQKPYQPIEGVVNTDPVEKQMAGDMSPSKRANLERAKQTQTAAQPEAELPPVADEATIHANLDKYARDAEAHRAEVLKEGLADVAANPVETEHKTPDAA